MNKPVYTFLLVIIFPMILQAQTVSLCPDNSHYLMYKGKPTILITSAEHYGAVLNEDFNMEKYLNTLEKEGMNYTRIFSGSYVEIPGSFGIQNNTLAPAVGRFLTPWKRVEEEGLYRGEKKFDLSEWNPDYFQRIRRFVSMAGERDIIVEVTLFCSTYTDASWERHPFNPGNNINHLPENLDRKKSNTPDNGNLLEFQKKMVQKIITELNEFDNLFYEIQNEPWSDDPQKVMRTLRTLDPQSGQGDWYKWAEMASEKSLEWQKMIARVVVDTEKKLKKKHLIAQNYTNFKHSIDEIDPNISIINFHYAWPEAVWMNYGWNRPVSFDESGFAGSDTDTYLRQAWQFILGGGACFNNLDYSFFVGKEDGTGMNKAPGGGNTEFRNQLTILKVFMESFEFIKMAPDFNTVYHAPGVQSQCLSEPGKQYAIVFTGVRSDWVKLVLPKGEYHYRFISPYNGNILKSGSFKHKQGMKELGVPPFDRMVVLKIIK